jgi:hypothetical protein
MAATISTSNFVCLLLNHHQLVNSDYTLHKDKGTLKDKIMDTVSGMDMDIITPNTLLLIKSNRNLTPGNTDTINSTINSYIRHKRQLPITAMIIVLVLVL